MAILKSEYYDADPLNAAYSTGETVKHLYARTPRMDTPSDITVLASGLSGDTYIRNIVAKTGPSANLKIGIYADNGNKEIKKNVIDVHAPEITTLDFTTFRDKTLRELAEVNAGEDPIGGYTVCISPVTQSAVPAYIELTLSR